MFKCSGCSDRGEVGGLTPSGYETEVCPFCKGNPMNFKAKPATVIHIHAESEPDSWFIIPSGYNGKYIILSEDPEGCECDGRLYTIDQLKERFPDSDIDISVITR